MRKKGWILALCALLLCGVACGRTFSGEELRSCSVSTGGGMLGGYRNVTLRRADGGAVLEVREKQTHADREITTRYAASDEAFSRVAEIVNRHALYAASKRRYSPVQVLDGDTTSISFTFRSEYFSVSENQVLSNKMREGFREVERCLNALAVGEAAVEIEPQRAMLYLRSGYTLQLVVADAFDGKLDEILSVERPVSRFGDCGIVFCTGEPVPLPEDGGKRDGAAGELIYDPESGAIVLLYEDHAFDGPVWALAALDDYLPTACPLIAEMEGDYRLYLN